MICIPGTRSYYVQCLSRHYQGPALKCLLPADPPLPIPSDLSSFLVTSNRLGSLPHQTSPSTHQPTSVPSPVRITPVALVSMSPRWTDLNWDVPIYHPFLLPLSPLCHPGPERPKLRTHSCALSWDIHTLPPTSHPKTRVRLLTNP